MDEDRDRSILERIDALSDLGLFEGAHTVPVMSAQGKDDKVPFRIKQTLERVTGTPIEIFFIRDGDGLPKEWRAKLEEFAARNDVKLLLLSHHEIESYLIQPDLITRALSQLQVNVTASEVETILASVMRDTVSRSKYGFDRTLRDGLYNTGRLMNEEYSIIQAESEAASIRAKYEDLQEFSELVRIAPAKETLAEFYKLIKQRWGVQLTSGRLLRLLERGDIDSGLLTQLQSIIPRSEDATGDFNLVAQQESIPGL